MGYSWGSFGLLNNIVIDTTPSEISGIGFCIRGASSFVMRADYFPPQKSCLSRAKDRLVEKLNERKLEPVFQPAFAPAKFERCLEDYF